MMTRLLRGRLLSLLLSLLLGGLGLAWAAGCEPVPEGALELAIEGVGVAYFASLGPAPEGGLELGGGVCVAGEAGWVLRAAALVADDLEAAPRFSAAEVELAVSGWQLRAQGFAYAAGAFSLEGIAFAQGMITGEAERGSYAPQRGELRLVAVRVRGQGFRLSGARARLVGDTVLFDEAEATTCLCSATALYLVRAPSASYDLLRSRVAFQDGELVLGSLRLALDDVALDPESLSRLSFPLSVEYTTGETGSGLGIRLRELPLTRGLSLELGVTGLDVDYPLSGVLMAHYQDEVLSFDVGRSALGAQADVALRQPLAAGLWATFAVDNRHWAAADYLHQGVLGLEAEQRLASAAVGRVTFSERLFGAVSSQQVTGLTRAGVRFGALAEARYQSPATPLGRFGATLRLSASAYPQAERSQFGAYFRPTWAFDAGALRLSAQYELQLVAGASPFTSTLDRLLPTSRLALSARLAGPLAEGLSGELALDLGYDVLDPRPSGRLVEGVTSARFEAALSYRAGAVSVEPYARGELAPVWNEEVREGSGAFVETGFEVAAERWQFGVGARFDLLKRDPLEKVEATVTFPIELGAVTLQPFLALDFAPLLRRDQFPRVSGHGLELSWDTDCGILVVGYRQLENTFSTSLALRLPEGP